MRPYRGQYPEIVGLEVGDSVIIHRPETLTRKEHARMVRNAVTNFGMTRGRRFRCKPLPYTGSIRVTRVYTDSEAANWSYEL